MKETKTILYKKEGKAIFIYQWGSEKVEFVVATLHNADLSKKVGEVVSGWYSGVYFNDITRAVEFFNKRY